MALNMPDMVLNLNKYEAVNLLSLFSRIDWCDNLDNINLLSVGRDE